MGVGECDKLTVEYVGDAVTVTVVLDRDKTVVKGTAGCPSKKLVGFSLGQATGLHGPCLQ